MVQVQEGSFYKQLLFIFRAGPKVKSKNSRLRLCQREGALIERTRVRFHAVEEGLARERPGFGRAQNAERPTQMRT